MKCREIITEIFQDTRGYTFTGPKSQGNKVHFQFYTDTGTEYLVSFAQELDETIPGWEQGWRIWEVEFEQLGVDSGFGITGAGDAIAVLATVIDIIKTFISQQNSNNNPVAVLNFSGTETSRRRLYHTMINMFTRFAGSDFSEYSAGAKAGSVLYYIWNQNWKKLCDELSEDAQLKLQDPERWSNANYWRSTLEAVS